MKINDIDLDDPRNWGRSFYWDVDLHIKAVEQLIRADELQLAMKLLDMVPAWQRIPENYPKELQEIKKLLYQRTYDLMEYSHDDDESGHDRSFGENQWKGGVHEAYTYPRAEIVEGLLKEIGSKVWIADLGASHGNLPLGLIKNGFKFDYLGLCLNWRIEQKLKSWVGEQWKERPDPGQVSILISTEVIEHSTNPTDIVHSAYKVGVDFDYIVLSLPTCCLGGGIEDWNRRLGHVRGWNHLEFGDFARKHWPNYQWKMCVAPASMVLVGKKC